MEDAFHEYTKAAGTGASTGEIPLSESMYLDGDFPLMIIKAANTTTTTTEI